MKSNDPGRLQPVGNAQQVLVAIFRALEASEGSKSLRRAVHATRSLGYKFPNTDATQWLTDFVGQAEGRSENGRFQKDGTGRGTVSVRDTSTKRDSFGEGHGPARTVKVSLIKANDPTDRCAPPKRDRRMKQPPLDLGVAAIGERNLDAPKPVAPHIAICDACWPIIEADYVGDRNAWYRANVRAAKAFTEKGVTAEQVVKVLRDMRASDFDGYRGATMLASVAKAWGRFTNRKPRFDSCYPPCRIPEDAPPHAELRAGETAHWDGDEYIYGSTSDPKRAHGR